MDVWLVYVELDKFNLQWRLYLANGIDNFLIRFLISPFTWQCCKIPRSKSCSLHNYYIPLPICFDVWGLGSWNLPVAGSISSYSTWKQAQYTGKHIFCVINKVIMEGSCQKIQGACDIYYAPSWMNVRNPSNENEFGNWDFIEFIIEKSPYSHCYWVNNGSRSIQGNEERNRKEIENTG